MNKLIIDTLKPIGVPVSFMNYNQTADTFIVFMEYNQAPFLNADNAEKYTKHFFQIDVFSTGNYVELVKEVKTRMKQAGFGRMYESETYEEEMRRFRKIIRFSYISREEN